jgi:hypothetical protein
MKVLIMSLTSPCVALITKRRCSARASYATFIFSGVRFIKFACARSLTGHHLRPTSSFALTKRGKSKDLPPKFGTN